MPKGSWREFDESQVILSSNRGSSVDPKKDRKVRVQRTKGGKSGKTVTVIIGLGLERSELKTLLKHLKAS